MTKKPKRLTKKKQDEKNLSRYLPGGLEEKCRKEKAVKRFNQAKQKEIERKRKLGTTIAGLMKSIDETEEREVKKRKVVTQITEWT